MTEKVVNIPANEISETERNPGNDDFPEVIEYLKEYFRGRDSGNDDFPEVMDDLRGYFRKYLEESRERNSEKR